VDSPHIVCEFLPKLGGANKRCHLLRVVLMHPVFDFRPAPRTTDRYRHVTSARPVHWPRATKAPPVSSLKCGINHTAGDVRRTTTTCSSSFDGLVSIRFMQEEQSAYEDGRSATEGQVAAKNPAFTPDPNQTDSIPSLAQL
jgi:hypothetical protein